MIGEVKWFDNEFKAVAEFSCEVAPLIAGVEAYEEKIKSLIEDKNNLKLEIGEQITFDSRKAILEHTIHILRAKNQENVEKLKQIKEAYLAEEFLDTLEILTSVDQGEKISEDACDLLKKISTFCLTYAR